jgi:hypothetical protein
VTLGRLFRVGLAGASFGFLTVVPANSQPDAIPADRICAHTGAPFVGPCLAIHGKLVAGGDNIQVRIYPKGSKRILGYADGALRCSLPTGLEEILETASAIDADAMIRPVTVSTPGVMQFVCIASVTNMKIKR